MIEVLFRAKRSYNKKWIIGLPVKQLNSDGSDELCIQTWKRDDEGVSSRVLSIIPSTVGQYIGSHDKNGEKIFEGDIVKADDDKLGVITYEEGEAKFAILYDDNDISDFDSFWGYNLEVIGNIYDDPELDPERLET